MGINSYDAAKNSRQAAEECVLSCLMIENGKNLPEVPFAIQDFTDGINRNLFAYIVESFEEHGCCDERMIAAKFPKQLAEISTILNSAPLSRHLPLYAKELQKHLIKEKSKALQVKAAKAIHEGKDIIEVARETTKEMDDIQLTYNPSSIRSELDHAMQSVFERIRNRESLNTLTFDFPEIDDLTGGLLPGEYVVIAARPSMGKSAFALQLLKLLAEKQIKSHFFSLEMAPISIAGRLLSQVTWRNTRKAIRQADKLNDIEQRVLLDHEKITMELCKYIGLTSTAGIKFQAICSQARKAVQNGARLIALDYLQLVEALAPSSNRNNEVEVISRKWKALLKELKVPGIMVSQLSRKCEENKRLPVLSDLRDSGAIEQDADVVWFLGKPYPQKKGEIIADNAVRLLQAKGRDHGTGFVDLMFLQDHQQFQLLEKEEKEEWNWKS